MSSAAGAEIGSRKTYQTDLSCQLLFTSVGQNCKLLFIRIKNFYRLILPYFSVGFFFDLRKLPFIKNAAEVNGDHIAAHMKTHIIVSICLMYQTAYYVFPGMLLHQIKPSLPVYPAGNFCSRLQFSFHIMDQLSVLFLNICNFCISQNSQITGLSASLRIKCAPIQKHLKALLSFSAFHNLCRKLFYINVLII